jgi:hypothetical protein
MTDEAQFPRSDFWSLVTPEVKILTSFDARPFNFGRHGQNSWRHMTPGRPLTEALLTEVKVNQLIVNR